MQGLLQDLLLSPPRLGENHAAGRHVREAAAHGDAARGRVRERPGAAQGAVPGLLLLRPAGARVPGPCPAARWPRSQRGRR